MALETQSLERTTLKFEPVSGSFFFYFNYFLQFLNFSDEFDIINQYGGISTYYIPDTGIDHWFDQIKKYAPQ